MRRDEFQKLLQNSESSFLDWKADFPAGLIKGSRHPDWEKGKAELLKDIVSIANNDDGGTGFLVYGVKDHGTHREVIGIGRNWDDADFQTWAQTAFDPPPQFLYSELAWKNDKTVGMFSIDHVADYPHVASRSIDRVFCEGQVWYRFGTRNSVADHGKLRNMFLGQEPYALERMDGSISNKVKQHYESQACTVQWRRFGNRDELVEQGFSLAYFPGTRRPILVMNRGEPDLILMVRP